MVKLTKKLKEEYGELFNSCQVKEEKLPNC